MNRLLKLPWSRIGNFEVVQERVDKDWVKCEATINANGDKCGCKNPPGEECPYRKYHA
jgi:hypothetical protein